MENFVTQQKLLLIKKLEDDKLKEGIVSQRNKNLIDFFYKWNFASLGFNSCLIEFNKGWR